MGWLHGRSVHYMLNGEIHNFFHNKKKIPLDISLVAFIVREGQPCSKLHIISLIRKLLRKTRCNYRFPSVFLCQVPVTFVLHLGILFQYFRLSLVDVSYPYCFHPLLDVEGIFCRRYDFCKISYINY